MDILKTVAIMDASDYLRKSSEIVRATEGIGQSQSVFDKASGAMALSGGLLVGLGAKAVKTASDYQTMQKALEKAYGVAAGDKLFAQMKQFTLLTPYTLRDWGRLAPLMRNLPAKDLISDMRDLGDAVTAAYGPDADKLKHAARAMSEIGRGSVTRQQLKMLDLAGVKVFDYLPKNLGLDEKQMKNFGKMNIPKEYVEAAIFKGIESDPSVHGAMPAYMKTLTGQTRNLQDNWNNFMAEAGKPFLQPTADAIGFIADKIKYLGNHPSLAHTLGEGMIYGGPALLVGSVAGKAVKFWSDLANAKNLAAIAAKGELGMEVAKNPILKNETDLAEKAAGKWGKFGEAVGFVGRNMGVLSKGLMLVWAAKDAMDVFSDTRGSFFDIAHGDFLPNTPKGFWENLKEKAQHPFSTIASIPTRMIGGAPGDFTRYATAGQGIIEDSHWQKGIDAFNRLKPELAKIENNWGKVGDDEITKAANRLYTIVQNTRKYMADNPDAGSGKSPITAQADAEMKAYDDILKKWASVKNQYTGIGDNPANDMLSYQLDRAETLMKISQMRAEHADPTKHKIKNGHGTQSFYDFDRNSADAKNFNMYKAQAISLVDKNIAALAREAEAYKKAGKSAEWLKDEKKILELMTKKQDLADTKLGKNKGGFDPTMASIISSAGMSEDDILARAGIGRRFFRSLTGKHGELEDPLKKMLTGYKPQAKQPIHISLNLNLDGKTLQTLAVKLEAPIVESIVHMLEGSGNRPIMAGG